MSASSPIRSQVRSIASASTVVDSPGQPIDDLRDAYEAALEKGRGMDDKEMEMCWADSVPETIREYPIQY